NKLLNLGLNYRNIFWVTGILSFFLSAVLDNLTTALIMCAVVLAIGKNNKKFVSLSCINIVVAANAGGVFSPFGDITTLMVWQKGHVNFFEFFKLFIPACVNYLVPAFCLQITLPKTKPEIKSGEEKLIKGGTGLIFLFGLTMATAVGLHHVLHFPPVFGMMLGLGYLLLYTYYLNQRKKISDPLDIFKEIQRTEWDTFLFFYGIIFAVSALDAFGFLNTFSEKLYQYGETGAHAFIGLVSAVVDNIPVMYAVLNMNETLSLQQWLLVTLTTGVGGSVLAIGSAAGVALMGQARGHYTFMSHLKWSWAILLGYAASIACHLLLN
ncbi:MAG: sodium:proton antiporter NhaD, partial [Gammaproteobacteria bacterium]